MRAAIVWVGVAACGFPVMGSGESATEDRAVSGFHSVRVTSNVDVDVIQGDAGASVTCDDNLLEHLQTEVRGDSLVVGVPSNVSVSPRVECYVVVSVPDLDALDNTGSASVHADGVYRLSSVRNTGSGRIAVDELDAGRLEVVLTGSGDVVLFGAANVLDARTTGSGDLDAAGLVARDASVRTTGSGDVDLTVTGSVDATVTGSGDIRIGGDPEHVERKITGSGSIIVR